MAEDAGRIAAFLARHADCALVQVAEARGSTPREVGARMLVARDATFDTIGGGQLEWRAIDEARHVYAEGRQHRREAVLDIPLGPEIGQCCGGRVKLTIRCVDDALRSELVGAAREADALLPDVFLFGGGHVGQALAASLALLPVRVTVVETRADALQGLPARVGTLLAAVPEETVRAARPGSAFVILTHDHALDFMLAAEALKHGDAAYVGMIGSETKRATFRRWFRDQGGGTEAQLGRLICPIGASAVRDKRPAVIAALAAAEIIGALAAGEASPPGTATR